MRMPVSAGDRTFIQCSLYTPLQGSFLLVPGSDIHWGDSVNTASKLSEDVAAPMAQGILLPPLPSPCGSEQDLRLLAENAGNSEAHVSMGASVATPSHTAPTIHRDHHAEGRDSRVKDGTELKLDANTLDGLKTGSWPRESPHQTGATGGNAGVATSAQGANLSNYPLHNDVVHPQPSLGGGMDPQGIEEGRASHGKYTRFSNPPTPSPSPSPPPPAITLTPISENGGLSRTITLASPHSKGDRNSSVCLLL